MKMRILLFTIAYLLMNCIALQAKDLYVNGIIGNDKNNGLNPDSAHALKTIQKAVDLAGADDKVLVAGKFNDDQIIYKENVLIGSDKFGIELKGEDMPAVDGAKNKTDSLKKAIHLYGNAFTVLASKISISGFLIVNYISAQPVDREQFSGAGIYASPETAEHNFKNNQIKDCNWGIFLDGTIKCKVDNNLVINTKMIKGDDKYYSGSGIVIYPSGKGIEENQIGVVMGNSFSNSQRYGLAIGMKTISSIADMSKIQNNVLQGSDSAGIAVFNIDGILNISKNTFVSDECSLILQGDMIDTQIAENIFIGSRGINEIIAYNIADGYYLYDVWRNNNNKFRGPTASALMGDSQIAPINNVRYIRTSKVKAKQDAGTEYKLDVLNPQSY